MRFSLLAILVALVCATPVSEPRAAEWSRDQWIAILDHTAIVGEMIRACGHARPDLAEPLSAAQTAWWWRNVLVRDMLAKLRKNDGDANSAYLAQYFAQTKASLRRRIDKLDESAEPAYAPRCDDILHKLQDGRLDFAPSTGN